MLFRLQTLRFNFVARHPIRFPTPASNLLRGAFGAILHAMETDAYTRIFAPVAAGTGPSGLADRPRPFVFRARHLDGITKAAGDSFHFDVNFFDIRPGAAADLQAAFARLPPAELSSMSAELLALDLAPAAHPVDRVVVHFLTPTELKASAEVVDLPRFEILAARIRDRISTLRALYGDGPLDLDFRAFAARAARVQIARIDTHWVEYERRSGRTGQAHSLGGFTGEVEYEGDLREFVPYLEAARYTGVGRQTVWGKGEIDLFY